MTTRISATLIGVLFIWVLSLIGILVAQAYETHQLALRITELEMHRNREEIFVLRMDRQAREFEEFQQWRISVTLASRHGWGAANRYIASYPLWLPGEPVPWYTDLPFLPEYETTRVFGYSQ